MQLESSSRKGGFFKAIGVAMVALLLSGLWGSFGPQLLMNAERMVRHLQSGGHLEKDPGEGPAAPIIPGLGSTNGAANSKKERDKPSPSAAPNKDQAKLVNRGMLGLADNEILSPAPQANLVNGSGMPRRSDHEILAPVPQVPVALLSESPVKVLSTCEPHQWINDYSGLCASFSPSVPWTVGFVVQNIKSRGTKGTYGIIRFPQRPGEALPTQASQTGFTNAKFNAQNLHGQSQQLWEEGRGTLEGQTVRFKKRHTGKRMEQADPGGKQLCYVMEDDEEFWFEGGTAPAGYTQSQIQHCCSCPPSFLEVVVDVTDTYQHKVNGTWFGTDKNSHGGSFANGNVTFNAGRRNQRTKGSCRFKVFKSPDDIMLSTQYLWDSGSKDFHEKPIYHQEEVTASFNDAQQLEAQELVWSDGQIWKRESAQAVQQEIARKAQEAAEKKAREEKEKEKKAATARAAPATVTTNHELLGGSTTTYTSQNKKKNPIQNTKKSAGYQFKPMTKYKYGTNGATGRTTKYALPGHFNSFATTSSQGRKRLDATTVAQSHPQMVPQAKDLSGFEGVMDASYMTSDEEHAQAKDLSGFEGVMDASYMTSDEEHDDEEKSQDTEPKTEAR